MTKGVYIPGNRVANKPLDVIEKYHKKGDLLPYKILGFAHLEGIELVYRAVNCENGSRLVQVTM